MIVVMTVGATLMGIAVSLLLALVRTQERGKAHAEQQMTLARLADQFRRDVHAARAAANEGPEKGNRALTGRPLATPPRIITLTSKAEIGPGMMGPMGAMGPMGPGLIGPGMGGMPGSSDSGASVKPAARSKKLTQPPVAAEPPAAAAKYRGPKWRLDLGAGQVVRYWVVAGAVVREEAVDGKTTAFDSFALPDDYSAEMTFDAEKGDRHLLGEAPEGPFRQKVPVPFFVHLIVAPREASLRRGHKIQIDAVLGRDHRFAKQEKGGK